MNSVGIEIRNDVWSSTSTRLLSTRLIAYTYRERLVHSNSMRLFLNDAINAETKETNK